MNNGTTRRRKMVGGVCLAELGAGEIVFEHVRVTVEIDGRQRVVRERHERGGHVHREIGG